MGVCFDIEPWHCKCEEQYMLFFRCRVYFIVTTDIINQAVKNALWTAKEAELNDIAEKVGVVLKNGGIKIIRLTEFDFENGIRF